jgi:hypothetical protein
MSGIYEKLEELVKGLEAGGYNAAPDTLRQGSALQVEDCSAVMHNVTFSDKHIKLQRMLTVKPAKSTFVQYNLRLSYGQFGGSAQPEGQVGQEQTSDYVRRGMAMSYYSEIRRTTLASNMVKTQTGEKPEDLEAEGAAIRIAADVEFDLFYGRAHFSNAGVFDGNPGVIPAMANLFGIDPQVRGSDLQTNLADAMFESFGGSLSVVISGGGTLTQTMIEDAAVRSAMNHGSADKLLVDPLVLSAYNQIAFGKERIILAGSPQDATGGDLRRQWVAGGTVNVEASRFLSGKTGPIRARASNSLANPTFTTGRSGGSTPFKAAEVYQYYVTAENEIGESAKSPVVSLTIVSNGDQATLTITPGTGTSRFFNVYRSAAGGTGASAKFIGRVVNSGAATTSFVDLGNKLPAFVVGMLIQDDTMEIRELAPYSTMKLAVSDLSEPTAHFRFVCNLVTEPRKNVLIDNLKGSATFG